VLREALPNSVKQPFVFFLTVVAFSAFRLFAKADLLGRVDVYLLVLVTNFDSRDL
jgi:hypothetical protein